jgi:predicted amidohydrolase
MVIRLLTVRARHCVTQNPREGAVERAQDALTNLMAYVMTLDAVYLRLDDRLVELADTDSDVSELQSVLREREDIAAEREAFRRAVISLRERLPDCSL